MSLCPICPICGRASADPILEDGACADCSVELPGRELADARRAWLYDAAFRALALARVYRGEEGPGGARERGCLEEVARLRRRLSAGRARAPAQGPGLAKSPSSAPGERQKSG